MMQQPTFPGCLLKVRPVGIMGMIDTGEKDYKILAVPVDDPRFAEIQNIDDVPEAFKKEVQHFFSVYKNLQGKKVDVLDWEDIDAAKTELVRSIDMYKEKY